MIKELYTEGVRWQAQAEQRWLAELLANEKATEIGEREGARERELEWE